MSSLNATDHSDLPEEPESPAWNRNSGGSAKIVRGAIDKGYSSIEVFAKPYDMSSVTGLDIT